MYSLILSLLLLGSPLLSTVSSPTSSKQQTSLQSAIDQVISDHASDVTIGVEVLSLKNGKMLYQKNPHHLLVPASCLKLITAAASLHLLGPQERFATELYTDGKVKDKTLKGNLYLKGSGDPELSFQDLKELAMHLKARDIHTIEGNLYLDDTLFDEISQGPGWMWDEGSERWNAPMAALMVNHSCVDVWVKPAEEVGKTPMVYLHPKTPYIAANNEAITIAEGGKLCVGRRWMQQEDVIDIQGQISAQKDPQHFAVSVENPSLYTGHVFREILFKSGITFKGGIEKQETPKNASLIGSHFSQPVSSIVQEMMKVSDNLAANCLFKKMGEKRFGAPGTWKKGADAVHEFLFTKVGLNPEKMVIVDGSGLSRYNLISADQCVQLLKWMHVESNACAPFLAALPISGTDGTLQERMTAPELIGKVRAKTGSMTGISSLSGYLTTKEGELLAFSIFQNGFIGELDAQKEKVEDQICALLVNFFRK